MKISMSKGRLLAVLALLLGCALLWRGVFEPYRQRGVPRGAPPVRVATALGPVKEYFNFVLSFVLPFGVMFELPVVIYMLARHGKVTYKTLSKNRKYVILVIAVVACIVMYVVFGLFFKVAFPDPLMDLIRGI